MTIEILPARLANQIAAGEVVERPASVVKELVENSLDAGATAIKIDIEKGGVKRIRISDNGIGIVKDELTLALSRHATSKIKNLNDLEGINSLGFRGEALASISSVARLTLTSKPQTQESAWQACAQGREMEVSINPAAHSDGTTIDVVDLFFNTPARRKFMRTEKTEFSHIEEVIKRIALARFDVAFVLTHNGKVIRQYRVATNDNKRAKRVSQVCGQAFIDNAMQVDCQHDGLTLTGWIAKPSFSRKQNDLCYSYVNGRMMRDKLINHAIRQSYNEMLPPETYPAFVLFLTLDVRDVDVNVHPAKHEVRFHQGRYVHDFIYSVCHQALINTAPVEMENKHTHDNILADNASVTTSPVGYSFDQQANSVEKASEQVQEYVKPLTYLDNINHQQPRSSSQPLSSNTYQRNSKFSAEAGQAYQNLMTPITADAVQNSELLPSAMPNNLLLQFVEPSYAIYVAEHQPRLVSLIQLENKINRVKISQQWQQGLTSQPLLLPIKLTLLKEDVDFIEGNAEFFNTLGMVSQRLSQTSVQIRQYPALLRQQDVSQSFSHFLKEIIFLSQQKLLTVDDWQQVFTELLTSKQFDEIRVNELYQLLSQLFPETINQELALNSKAIDLTSSIEQLN
ncbi:MAG: DNA mismatch repair endonuclease MutL [Colwelliaceae bacterium]|nr:DNA mismatch repair endonuclease MutL [Colwelliaceae bacterium]